MVVSTLGIPEIPGSGFVFFFGYNKLSTPPYQEQSYPYHFISSFSTRSLSAPWFKIQSLSQFFMVIVWIWLQFGFKSSQGWSLDGCTGHYKFNWISKQRAYSFFSPLHIFYLRSKYPLSRFTIYKPWWHAPSLCFYEGFPLSIYPPLSASPPWHPD